LNFPVPSRSYLGDFKKFVGDYIDKFTRFWNDHNQGKLVWDNIVATNATITNLNNVAWTAYTPVITAEAGTITTSSASGRYSTIGKSVFFSMVITITTSGTGTGNLMATLPINTKDTLGTQMSAGIEATVTGSLVHGLIASNSINIRDYINNGIISNGATVYISGTYEAL
jgi:hypothetical protein